LLLATVQFHVTVLHVAVLWVTQNNEFNCCVVMYHLLQKFQKASSKYLQGSGAQRLARLTACQNYSTTPTNQHKNHHRSTAYNKTANTRSRGLFGICKCTKVLLPAGKWIEKGYFLFVATKKKELFHDKLSTGQ